MGDRASTARAFCDLSNPPESFSKPGHLFPLCARSGGVLERPGHTESTYDMCRLSGMTHVGLLAELMHDDGTMFRKESSLEFAQKYGFKIVTVDQIIEYRRKQESEQHMASEVLSSRNAVPTMAGVSGKSTPSHRSKL